jgi:hypothetical protein
MAMVPLIVWCVVNVGWPFDNESSEMDRALILRTRYSIRPLTPLSGEYWNQE